jgi:hypothetical protein
MEKWVEKHYGIATPGHQPDKIEKQTLPKGFFVSKCFSI